MAVFTAWTNSGKRTTADRLQTTTTRLPPKFIGIGTGGGARTAAITDTALTTEVETRASGTETTQTITVTGDTYQTQGTITATGARTINEIATFDAATTGNIGLSATVADINLASADSLQITARTQFT